MNGKFPITKDTFEMYDADSKLNTMFDLMLVQHECSCETVAKVEDLKERFERRKKFDTTISGTSGLVGGAIAMLAKHIFTGKS
jgi:hypothetical protein